MSGITYRAAWLDIDRNERELIEISAERMIDRLSVLMVRGISSFVLKKIDHAARSITPITVSDLRCYASTERVRQCQN